VKRNVGGIMPVDPEQTPSTQTWGDVSSAIVKAWEDLWAKQDAAGEPRKLAPHMGVLKDGRVSPGRVSKALLDIPVVVGVEEVGE
jgi:hypothetical protein